MCNQNTADHDSADQHSSQQQANLFTSRLPETWPYFVNKQTTFPAYCNLHKQKSAYLNLIDLNNQSLLQPIIEIQGVKWWLKLVKVKSKIVVFDQIRLRRILPDQHVWINSHHDCWMNGSNHLQQHKLGRSHNQQLPRYTAITSRPTKA
jgi:hypothetical protein